MWAAHLAYILTAMSPVGGLLVAIPFGVLEREYPTWLLLASGPSLAYVQVVVVDVAWDQLQRMALWQRWLDKQRSPRLEKLLTSRGAFWPTFLLAPIVGPMVVMALMRYAQLPQRRVALPIFASLVALTGLLVLGCRTLPEWFAR